ncbi:MAG: hypothetical protein ACLQU1_23760 [Bryobacteraceae bacterium]
MKTEVYSWRLSSELKSDLEREARLRGKPIASILEAAAREWLKRGGASDGDEDEQRRLHAVAAACIGAFAGDNPRRAETAARTIKKRLAERHAR